MTTTLTVAARGEVSATAARENGQIPAVVYGPKQEAISLVVNRREFEKMYEGAGESSIITLSGLDEDIEVLVQDMAFDPQKGGAIHLDFYAIERGKELTTNVPFEFIGEAPAEKTGATVNKIMHEVEVTCRPSNLPSSIEVDLSVLVENDSAILLKDLKVSEDVKIDLDPESVIANVSSAREEEPEEETAAVDMDAVEVEQKGKEDGGEETPAE